MLDILFGSRLLAKGRALAPLSPPIVKATETASIAGMRASSINRKEYLCDWARTGFVEIFVDPDSKLL